MRDELDVLRSRHVSWPSIHRLVAKKFLSVVGGIEEGGGRSMRRMMHCSAMWL